MISIPRTVMALLIGGLAAFFHLAAIQRLGQILYPPPPGLSPEHPETIAAYLKVIPTGALLVVVLGWALGSFAGSWLAARLAPAPRRAHGFAVGALLMMAAGSNLAEFPHPAWFWAALLGSIPPAAYLGATLAAPAGGVAPSYPDPFAE